MELSRRGVLGGIGSVCAIGAIGFVGASSVDDPSGENEPSGTDDTTTGSDEGDAMYVDADPTAPFEARLVGADATYDLFDASGLVHVEGVHPDDGEHLVVIELGEGAVDAVRAELDERGVVDEPSAFEIRMTLDDVEIRRIELDDATVDALRDDSWQGVVTLPFEDPDVAEDVYESLAAE
ncbi:hypothetical protein [Halorubrum sp. DTA98]|uniref:hypothetical protein n=1 Tax=Halorubrum sp. DTA98 TaxID=3402163 RepID=UPI003AB0F87A